MFFSASERAKWRITPMTPCLAAVYPAAPWLIVPNSVLTDVKPAAELVITTAPPSALLNSAGRAASMV